MTDKVLSAVIEYSAEKYNYQLKFNLENIGQYISSLSYDGKLLEHPEVLYKFFGRNKYSLNSLSEGYLYFADPRVFNDPFDCLVNREKFIVSGKDYMLRHRDNIGVCCFSTVRDNPLMWGHYGNCFSSFSVKMRNNFPSKDIAIKSHVAYLKNYSRTNQSLISAINSVETINLKDSQKNTLQGALKMAYEYCWKYYDWKYEKEYRAVSINALSFDRKLFFDKNQVEEIYIGYRMEINFPTYYKNLRRIIRKHYPTVKVFEVSPHPVGVKLEFK